MPTKTHWTINPKKWFENISPSALRHEKKENPLIQSLPAKITVARTSSLAANIVRSSKARISTKITPISTSTEVENNHTINLVPFTRVQLPPFTIRGTRAAALLPSLSFNRPTTFVPIHTEPTIRRNGRCEENLSINTKRRCLPLIISVPPTTDILQQTIPIQPIEMSLISMSHRCLIDFPRHSPDPIVETPSPAGSSSASSLVKDNNNNNLNSSSGEVYQNITNNSESKEPLLTMKVLSVESLAESETSLTHIQSRPIIHHYQTILDSDKSPQPISLPSSPLSQSLEDVFEDSQTFSERPTTTVTTIKRPPSSVMVDKTNEKRIRISPSPRVIVDKTEFIRTARMTYRLCADEIEELSTSPHHSMSSFVPSCVSDDSLRPANDEECYATLPCGSSTEQMNKNIQHDLRTFVDDYIRPMAFSIGQNPSIKSHHRSKRSQTNNDDTQLIIEDITDKLLSSIDYPIYAQHQRYC
ncbi:hypothetical protein I4U23_002726 [Adineta vaga]|nr:hypothetical protein I4U23_002726 [Adineta vaga]